MVLSIFVALVLTPSLCDIAAATTKAARNGTDGSSRVQRGIRSSRARYIRVEERLLGKRAPAMVVYVVIVAAMALLLARLPTGFFPAEDQGGLFHPLRCRSARCNRVRSKSPSRWSTFISRTRKSGVHSTFIVAGFSFAGQGQNTGQAFVNLEDWDKRPGEVEQRAGDRRARHENLFEDFAMRRSFRSCHRRCANSVTRPVSNAARDRGDLGHEALMGAR